MVSVSWKAQQHTPTMWCNSSLASIRQGEKQSLKYI